MEKWRIGFAPGAVGTSRRFFDTADITTASLGEQLDWKTPGAGPLAAWSANSKAAALLQRCEARETAPRDRFRPIAADHVSRYLLDFGAKSDSCLECKAPASTWSTESKPPRLLGAPPGHGLRQPFLRAGRDNSPSRTGAAALAPFAEFPRPLGVGWPGLLSESAFSSPTGVFQAPSTCSTWLSRQARRRSLRRVLHTGMQSSMIFRAPLSCCLLFLASFCARSGGVMRSPRNSRLRSSTQPETRPRWVQGGTITFPATPTGSNLIGDDSCTESGGRVRA